MARSEAKLYGFPRDDVPGVWPELVPWLKKGLEVNVPDEHLLDIYVDLLARKKQLWAMVLEGTLVGSGLSKIEKDEGAAVVCWIFTLAGENLLPSLPAMFKQFELWAKAEGCHVIRIAGRRGWKRVFKDWDWHVADDGSEYLEKIL